MIDCIPNRPLYFYQKDILDISYVEWKSPQQPSRTANSRTFLGVSRAAETVEVSLWKIGPNKTRHW